MSDPRESNLPIPCSALSRKGEGATTPLGQIIIYPSEDGRVKIEVRLENETVWLTQQHMAELFQTSKQNVGQHLKTIFAERELSEDSVVKNFFTTAADGKNYATNFYNLDAIISVGYRVKSAIATRFRIWATQRLREYIVKGFVAAPERQDNLSMEAKTGSAQSQVTIENLNYVKAITPTKPLAAKFCAISTPIYEQVDLLHRQIHCFRQTRNQLPPRLLSGQIKMEVA